MSSDPSTDTGWTFFHIKLLQKLQCLFEKDIKNEAGKCRFSKECCEEHTFNSESKRCLKTTFVAFRASRKKFN